MDLNQLIQWLTGGSGQDEEELARQMKLAKMKQERPWLFKSDSQGYAPDEMMMFKNPDYMRIMNEHNHNLNNMLRQPNPNFTGQELNQLLMNTIKDQDQNVYLKKRIM